MYLKMTGLSKLIAALAFTATAHGFAFRPENSALQAASLSELPSVAESMYDTPSECYIIYPEDDAEDQDPKFVCTNSPEEYAWFNGINTSDMIPAEQGTSSLNAMECQETESFRGIPEWECSLGMTNLRP